jgi:predicted permease
MTLALTRKLRAFWIRLRAIFAPGAEQTDLQAELESHLQMHIDDNLRAGMNPQQARRDAILKLGGVEQTKQAYRERGTLPWLEDLLQDVRYALRMMARSRVFTAIAVLSLAIGIGTSTTVFSWIDAVLVRPLPGVAGPERLVALESVTPGGDLVPNSYPDYRDFRDHLKLFDGIAAYRPSAFSIGQDDHAERIWGELVSGNFFAVLGVDAAAGRVFLPSEYGDKPGAFPIAVISDRYWRSHFHADPNIAGKTIRVNQHELTIVGVAPPDFQGSMPATAFDIWVPYVEQSVLNGVSEQMALLNRQNRNMLGIARIRHDATMQQAQHELAALATYMSVANADVSQGMSATLLPLSRSPHGPQASLAAPLKILMGISALVLLIVCANVANLLLAKAAAREKEFTTRLALGAARSRLTRQVLTESLMLAFAGGAAGIAMTAWMSRSLKFLLPPGQLTLTLDSQGLGLHWNGHILLFVLALCVFAALLAGLAPVLHLRHLNLNQRLNENARATGRSQRLRSSLVVSEVALALIALIGAGLFAQEFAAIRRIDPGFDPGHVLVSQFYLATSGYNLEQREAFCRRLQEKLGSTPGIVNAAYSDIIPLGIEPSWWEDLRIEGYTPAPGENMKIFRNVISPGYLGTHAHPARRRPQLHRARQRRAHLPQRNDREPGVRPPLLRRQGSHRPENPRMGRLVYRRRRRRQDSKYHYLGESPLPYTYFPFRQVYRTDMHLAFYVRTQGDPDAMLATLRQKVREIDGNVTVFDAAPLQELIGASLYPAKGRSHSARRNGIAGRSSSPPSACTASWLIRSSSAPARSASA